MDVGLTVNETGLISALFAFLACVALAVELGRKPQRAKPPDEEEEAPKVEKKKEEKKTEETPKPAEPPKPAPPTMPSGGIPQNPFAAQLFAQQAAQTPPPAPAPAPFPAPSAAAMEKTFIPERPFDQVQPTAGADQFEVLAAKHASAAMDALADLQRTYVDGLLAPRGKYDVALAILNEYNEATSVSEKDVGLTMATEAYLSATRSGTMSSSGLDVRSFFANKKSADSTAEDTTTKEKKAAAPKAKAAPAAKGKEPPAAKAGSSKPKASPAKKPTANQKKPGKPE